MTERIIDLSEKPAALKIRHQQLVIRCGEDETTCPIDEVAVLIAAHPAITYTQAVLSMLMEIGGVFLTCDGRRMPNGILLPLEGHHLQAERLQSQITTSQPTRKRLWQQLVQAKIRNQGGTLYQHYNDEAGITAMAQHVQSGDPQNLEAQAARKYWPRLFNDADFRRNREQPGLNSLLNYGYSILRAILARAIVATGLHPSLGLHHHNRYDAFCLADDLMEPYRPFIDTAVLHCLHEYGPQPQLNKDSKRLLLQSLTRHYPFNNEERSLFDCASFTAASLTQCLNGQRKKLLLPDLSPPH